MIPFKPLAAALVASYSLLPATSHASCGAAFCTVNTDWNVQGLFAEPGGRAELRYEYLRQSQLRAGSRKVSPGEVPSEHDEIYTKNQAVFGAFDYNVGDWGASLIVPVVQRAHEHVPREEGEATVERWNFRGVGDIRVAGRRQWLLGAEDTGTTQRIGLRVRPSMESPSFAPSGSGTMMHNGDYVVSRAAIGKKPSSSARRRVAPPTSWPECMPMP